MSKLENLAADVIVVGAGNAALTAAISARECGASVIVLEKAPKEHRGGNTRFTEQYRFSYDGWEEWKALIPTLSDAEARAIEVEPYTTDQFYNDMMYVSQDCADPEFCQVLVNESYSTIKWLVDLGAKWEIATEFGTRGADGILRFMPGVTSRPSGGGMGVLDTLFNVAEQRGITVLYETKATKLLTDDGGRVCGVRTKHRGERGEMRGKAVILACGGFQANREMRARYLDAGWDLAKVRGTRYDTGEGLRMALELGAGTTGHFSSCHACQVFLEGPDFEMEDLAWGHGFPNGILVNVLGKRFVDEGEDYLAYTYAKLGDVVFKQPKSIAYQVFDAKVMDLVLHNGRYRNVSRPVHADNIGELARKLSIEEQTLVATIQEYNAAVQEGTYNPAKLDGKATIGLSPNKSNWALRIDSPPFVAYPVTCGITFTYGGVKTNTGAQVVDEEGDPIPGLYAAGEVVGSFYYNYAGGTGLTKGAVFGRIAGRNAAAEQPIPSPSPWKGEGTGSVTKNP